MPRAPAAVNKHYQPIASDTKVPRVQCRHCRAFDLPANKGNASKQLHLDNCGKYIQWLKKKSPEPSGSVEPSASPVSPPHPSLRTQNRPQPRPGKQRRIADMEYHRPKKRRGLAGAIVAAQVQARNSKHQLHTAARIFSEDEDEEDDDCPTDYEEFEEFESSSEDEAPPRVAYEIPATFRKRRKYRRVRRSQHVPPTASMQPQARQYNTNHSSARRSATRQPTARPSIQSEQPSQMSSRTHPQLQQPYQNWQPSDAQQLPQTHPNSYRHQDLNLDFYT